MSDELRHLPDDSLADSRATGGVRDELAQLGSAFFSLLKTRLELAQLEYLETRRQTVKQLTLIFLAAIFLWVAFVAANVLLVVWFWDTPHRIDVLVGMIGVYCVLGVLTLLYGVSVRKQAPKPFAATLAEFEKDRKWLEAGMVSENAPPAPKKAERDDG